MIQKELGQIILKEIEFQDFPLVTITRIKTSVDLANASVYISVLPDERKERVLEVLGKMVYVLQKLLDKRLKIRPIPKIRFVEEKETAKAAHIEQILEELKLSEK